ncbi:hypothetical protein [Nostoc sp. GT001]|uniref:hypothetical protein n=1 Tax=Nostoc sp. GT001 TaxID=3056647 RepID=UPI0025AB00E1|nr:hypothetical protein [Nostoc sp. GT001]MDM9583107.1 hypothetical protein [Nostoc sp. GT001]
MGVTISVPAVTTKTTVFTSSGTFTKDPRAVFLLVQLWGASGGARGGGTTTKGTAGSGGSYKEIWIPASAITASVSVIIGAGGIGGTGSSATTERHRWDWR